MPSPPLRTVVLAAAGAVAALAPLAAGAGPAKESWDSVVKPEVKVEVLPRSALVEVDGQARGRGFATLDVTDIREKGFELFTESGTIISAISDLIM